MKPNVNYRMNCSKVKMEILKVQDKYVVFKLDILIVTFCYLVLRTIFEMRFFVINLKRFVLSKSFYFCLG